MLLGYNETGFTIEEFIKKKKKKKSGCKKRSIFKILQEFTELRFF